MLIAITQTGPRGKAKEFVEKEPTLMQKRSQCFGTGGGA